MTLSHEIRLMTQGGELVGSALDGAGLPAHNRPDPSVDLDDEAA